MKQIFSALICLTALTSCTASSGNSLIKNLTVAGAVSAGSIIEDTQEAEVSSLHDENVSADMVNNARRVVSYAVSSDTTDIYYNSDVEQAVKKGVSEKVNTRKKYSFKTSRLDKTYSAAELDKCFERLQKVCDEADFDLSFSYKNMDSDVQVSYMGDKIYSSCSIIKAPFVKSLLEHKVDVSEKIPRDVRWYSDVDEFMCSQKEGTKFTCREYMEYAIKESDNTAYYQLSEHYGTKWYDSMQKRLGNKNYMYDSIFINTTSDEMLRNYEDIYDFGLQSAAGEWLTDIMSEATLNIQIGGALGNKYKVSQKYGTSNVEDYFHDCAIVYADSPFVLCILTQGQKPETDESCKVFYELSYIFDDINSLLA